MNLFKAAGNWANRALKTKSAEPVPARGPDFFIVGAAKAGTTSLWQYLIQHPDIYMPTEIAWKEPSFYCDTYGVGDHAFYLSLFKDAKARQRIGEASTAYLSSPETPHRIKEAVPGAKIIIMLRNPADRAYSLYRWMYAEGYEKLAPFSAALEEEEKHRNGNPAFMQEHSRKGGTLYFRDLLYFYSGLYHEQVKAFYESFPADQIKVLIFEEFVKQSLPITQDVYRFLGIEANFTPEIKIHNEGKPGRGDFTPDIRRDMEQKYLADVRNLSKFLNKDLESAWFKPASH